MISNLIEAIDNDKTVSKMNDILKEINKTFTSSQNVKLYYIPKEVSKSTEDYIAIKDEDSIYYKCKLSDMMRLTTNPYILINEISNTLIDISNDKAKRIRDTDVISILDDLKSNESVIEIIVDKQYKNEKAKIKDTLDYVLEKISLPARSNKKDGFIITDKLDAIDDILVNSKYNKIYRSKNCVIYGQDTPKNGDKCILVSSHADIVSGITNVKSEYKNGYYHGTYDNLGTNASAVSIMLNDDKLVDKNVYFAFTAEEETGLCTGAEDAFKFITNNSKVNPLCIALDVTDEGYDENELISIEGLRGSKQMKTTLRDKVVELNGDSLSFGVAKASSKEYTPFEDAYITCDYTEFDESSFYGRALKQDSFSCCLPTDGYMHSNSGLNVKETAFIGYIYSLDTLLQSLTNTLDRSKLNDIRAFKDYLVYKTEQISKTPVPSFIQPYTSSYRSFSNPNLWNMDESEEYEEDEYMSLEDAFMLDDDGVVIDREAYELGYETLMDFASSYPDDYDSYKDDVLEVYGDIPEDIMKAAYDEFYGLCFGDETINEDDYDDFDYE